MAEDAKAATQYGDLTGTIAIDGFNGLLIDGLLVLRSSVPTGYHPVGIRIYGSPRQEELPLMKAKVLCVDTGQTGETPDEIRAFGKANGELHTFEFDADLDLDSILKSVKRYDIVLLSKLTRDTQVKIQPIQD